MPISDAFLSFEDEIIDARQVGKSYLDPMTLLGPIAAEYDQYRGDRQHDAHELLRHFLDGMRMEEMDIIKRRNPPPAPSTSSGPDPTAASMPEDSRMPFTDMVFGGTLASILVCEGCNHISHTYEDFLDLSLSIRPEDARGREPDKFKFLSKFRKSTPPLPTRTPSPTMLSTQPAIRFPSTETDTAVSNNPSTVDVHMSGVGGVEVVPHGLALESGKGKRPVSAGSTQGLAVSDGEISTAQPRARVSSVQISTEEHDWEKMGKDKDKSKERAKDKERPGDKKDDKAGKDTEDKRDKASSSRPPSPTIAPAFMEPHSSSAAVARSQPPSRKDKAAYLEKVLTDGDAPPTSSSASLQWAVDGLGLLKDSFVCLPIDDIWPELSSGRGSILDAIRNFTAVEVLDGDNAYACRRCWKIAHRTSLRRARKGTPGVSGTKGDRGKEPIGTTTASNFSYDSDSSDSDWGLDWSSGESSLMPPPPLAVPLQPASTSGIGSGPEQSARNTVLPRPSSAPIVEDRAFMMTTPTIQMISRDVERARPFPASPRPASPVLAHTSTQELAKTGSSGVTIAPTAPTSEVGPIIAAPVPRTPIALPTTLPTNPNASLTAIPPSQQYIRRRAFKRYLIATPPPVLVIHLKRFQQVASVWIGFFDNLRKLDDFVAFPEVLDITPFVAPNREEYGMGRAKKTAAARANDKVTTNEPGLGWFDRGKEKEKAVKYRLYAVVVHTGTMCAGHYIAYIALPPMPPHTPDGEDAPTVPEDPAVKGGDTKDKEGKDEDKRQWVRVDDINVEPVSFEEVSKAKAYMCFYERFYD
ncbi:hypothetical protein FS749_005277 [Ceratobasidium sp. UAMH 11750]|nr:hypothetical protein FS749_005277 [Ceratobasidium sp. UAMH 11750]